MWFEYSHAHDFGKDLGVSRSNVISNPNWQYHSKLNLIQLCRKNVKMSFGDKVIEKANEERRRLEREILCFFNLSVVSLLLSLWPPIAKYWSYISCQPNLQRIPKSTQQHSSWRNMSQSSGGQVWGWSEFFVLKNLGDFPRNWKILWHFRASGNRCDRKRLHSYLKI